MGGIGGPELLLVFFVILLIFGPKKIPEVARGLGKGVREFRKLSTEFQREMNLSDADEEKRSAPEIAPPRVESSAHSAPGDRPYPPGAEPPSGKRPLPPGAEAPSGERALPPGQESPSGERPLPPGAEPPSGERPLPPGAEPPSSGSPPGSGSSSPSPPAKESGRVPREGGPGPSGGPS